MSFFPLHIYSGNSFLKSGLTIEKIVKNAKKRNFPAVGISDYETLSGIASFYSACSTASIKAIIGEDLSIDDRLFSLYVKNEEGYRNLLEIHYHYQKKDLTNAFIKEHSAGLILILRTAQFDFSSKITVEVIKRLSFLVEDFYLGLDYALGYETRNETREFAAKYGYFLIAFPFVKYLKSDDAITLKIVEAIASDSKLKDKKENGSEYLLSDEDVSTYYTQEEISLLDEIKNKVDFNLIKKRGHLLVYPQDSGLTSDEYLRKIAFEKLAEKGHAEKEEYINRLNYELGIISSMGYSDYFLIVSDYVNYAKNNGILVGPGRGSAAGSLVAYVLNITLADPLKYDLLFERFLNPERKSMPDIDVDFSDIYRYKVVDYLKEKYGSTHVANILTLQTIAAKQSLRDVGRTYDYPIRDIELLTKTFNDKDRFDLHQNYRKTEQFRKIVDSDPYYLEIVTLASKIEYLPRQKGLHAAGIILNDGPLMDALPVFLDSTNSLTSEFTMDHLEEQGFLKMDLLGLRNLTIIENCLNRIKKDLNIDIDYNSIPYEDPDAIKLIHDGQTMGVFQLESAGMKRAIQTLKPQTFMDIVDLLALFRPGPMDNINMFARRKMGLEKVTYVSPLLEPILSSTQGIIVYQEQIINIANKVALFPMGKADTFRQAISKKKTDKMASLKVDFINGCIKNNIKKNEAEKIYGYIEKFAEYGFNKSHSLSYAILATQMAYLKAHYPQQFYASTLDNLSNKDENFNPMISEMRKRGLKLELPNVNLSTMNYEVIDDKIYFPLNSIKGILTAQVESIVVEREKNGEYKDFLDFVTRTYQYKVTSANIEKLIDAGAFDSMNPSRATLRRYLLPAVIYSETVGEYENALGLVDAFPKPEMTIVQDNKVDNLNREYELLGIMLSGSHVTLVKDKIKGLKITPISSIDYSEGDIKLCVFIKNERKVRTKKGDMMCFMTANDDSGERDFAVFPAVYLESGQTIKKGRIVIIDGYLKTNTKDFIITKVSPVEGEMSNE